MSVLLRVLGCVLALSVSRGFADSTTYELTRADVIAAIDGWIKRVDLPKHGIDSDDVRRCTCLLFGTQARASYECASIPDALIVQTDLSFGCDGTIRCFLGDEAPRYPYLAVRTTEPNDCVDTRGGIVSLVQPSGDGADKDRAISCLQAALCLLFLDANYVFGFGAVVCDSADVVQVARDVASRSPVINDIWDGLDSLVGVNWKTWYPGRLKESPFAKGNDKRPQPVSYVRHGEEEALSLDFAGHGPKFGEWSIMRYTVRFSCHQIAGIESRVLQHYRNEKEFLIFMNAAGTE